jgi:CTP synthase
MSKYIFITGGVISGLGKGIAAASIGRLLESHGYRITIQKFDPYLNVDPGTMSPFQHGEVYVTDDGAETDLDLGHYERFTSARMTRAHNWTAGKIYETIIRKERKGEYLGKTVQVIPHVTDMIKSAVESVADANDIVICEIGGTVGDIESQPFLEAIRQMRLTLGAGKTLFIHLTLVPYLGISGELKTKPTQHSVKELRAIGIQPDILLCRTARDLSEDIKSKIALFTNVPIDAVVTARDVDTIYEIPLNYAAQGLDATILRMLRLARRKKNLAAWEAMVDRLKHPKDIVEIGLVGKYAGLHDSYMSLNQALIHGGLANRLCVKIDWIEAEALEREDPAKILGAKDGILVPGGFGKRGIEGKIRAVTYARENKVPFFGICQQHRVRARRAPQGHRPLARAGPGLRHRRDDAAGAVPVRAQEGQRRPQGLPGPQDLRTPPPPLRVQPGLQRRPGRRRPGLLRHQSGLRPGRDHRGPGPSVVPRLPVPSRVQVQAPGPASALQGVHRGEL